MANTNGQMTTGKSVAVLAVVLGCFVILWPRLFLPMLQSAFTNKPKTLHASKSEMMHPRMRKSLAAGRPVSPGDMPYSADGLHRIPEQEKSNPNSVGYMMPIYTIAITALFLYTILRIFCKNGDTVEQIEPDKMVNSIGNKISSNQRAGILNHKRSNIKGECIRNLAVNYLNKRKSVQNVSTDFINENISKEDVSCAIRVLLQDMKQLKQHLLELEAQRKKLKMKEEEVCLMKENDEEDDRENDYREDVYCPRNIRERGDDSLSDSIKTDDEMADDGNSDIGADEAIDDDLKTDEDSEILGQTDSDSDIEE